jgi:uncharacterized membrane protein
VKPLTNFLKTAVAGGFVVVLPIILIAILLGQLIMSLVEVSRPLTEGLPFDPAVNALLGIVLGVSLALLICFVTGLLVRTSWGEKIRDWIDVTNRLWVRIVSSWPVVRYRRWISTLISA